MERYLSQNKFAQSLGLSKQAISLAVKDGRVNRTVRGIDPNHPTNKYFAEQVLSRTEPHNPRGKANKKKKTKRKPAQKTTQNTGFTHQNTPPVVHYPPSPPVAPTSAPAAPPVAPSGEQGEFYLLPPTNKAEADFHKALAATKKINMEIAAKMREMVHRDEVASAFGTLNSAIMDFFLPLGERLAPSVAGLAGSSDPEQVKEVQHAIEAEITRGLEEVKRIGKEAMQK